MIQNIYDNQIFFDKYESLRENPYSLNTVIIEPALKKLLPELHETWILDLGFGTGEICNLLLANGAKSVTGVDVSKNMLNVAKEKYNNDNIKFINKSMEEYDYPEEKFDIVISTMAFHYVYDFDRLIKNIYKTLRKDGLLIFSQEHPVITSKITDIGWHRDTAGNKLHWKLDDYNNEGQRNINWLVDGVIKYHRTMETIINTLIDNKFKIEKIIEPYAAEEYENMNKELPDERRRPMFLFVKCRKL